MRKGCWFAALLWIVTSGFTARGVVWDFEKDESAWRPRAETVEIRRIPWAGATQASRACLQVMGEADEGYNYALSSRTAMQERQWYRL